MFYGSNYFRIQAFKEAMKVGEATFPCAPIGETTSCSGFGTPEEIKYCETGNTTRSAVPGGSNFSSCGELANTLVGHTMAENGQPSIDSAMTFFAMSAYQSVASGIGANLTSAAGTRDLHHTLSLLVYDVVAPNDPSQWVTGHHVFFLSASIPFV